MKLQLDHDSEVPIYQQIVISIKAAIKDGSLPVGQKLPTVRELAAQISISRGTVKHAYEELEKQGLIQMTQGRGTFVQGAEDEGFSGRKERAMALIDKTIDEMLAMSFSMHDIGIFIDLKLREREEQDENVKVGVVDCNPETIESIQNQISSISGVEVYRFTLESVIDSAYNIDENLDLIVTTFKHYEDVLSHVGNPQKLLRLALSATQNTAASLAKVEAGQRIGVLCMSMNFSIIIRRGCLEFCGRQHMLKVRLFDDTTDLWDFLGACDVIVVPPNHLKFCSAADSQAIQKFAQSGGNVIPYEYQIDRGSLFHLEEQVNHVLQTHRA